jgi:adenosine deaminase
MASYKFQAVKTAMDVTNLLKNKRANKAKVAAVGQEPDENKKFNVWYEESHHNQNWQFAEIDFDPTSDTDTDKVTSVLNGSDLAAVTFFGQTRKYYVWWLS